MPWVLNPPVEPESLVLPGWVGDEQEKHVVGQGFEVEREMSAILEDGRVHRWTELWLVTRKLCIGRTTAESSAPTAAEG
jgi:hypothetical protein